MKYLKLASEIAKRDKRNKNYKLGAVAVRSDGSICYVHNLKVRTPTRTAHAECRALNKSGKCNTLYIVRVLSDGSWANARPCSSCRETIKQYKVKKVVYSISNSEYGIWYPNK